MFDDTPFLQDWADVSAGDPWQPEAAERYNAVNALLRTQTLSRRVPHAVPAGHLTGINGSDAAIPAGKAVVPVPPAVSGVSTFSGDQAADIALSSENTRSIWGITLETIPPHGSGTVLFSGIIAAEVSGTPGSFVTAGSRGSLQFASSGRAEVLKNGSSGKTLIMLGGGGNTLNEYNGMFKIVRGTQTLFRVVDGADPDSGIAGYTDFGPVSSAEFDRTGEIWLVCRFNGAPGEPMTSSNCGMSIVCGTPDPPCGKLLLGGTYSANGNYHISQWWRNNAVYWRTWYIL